MAFLIPALIALSGDVSLLVIRRMTPGSESWTGDGNSDDDLCKSFFIIDCRLPV